jgi:hypothetical protein
MNSRLTALLASDAEPVLAALATIRRVPWLTAVAVPAEALRQLEAAVSRLSTPGLADQFVLEAVEGAFDSRYGDRAGEISFQIQECLTGLRIPHHTALRTCRLYCKAVLVAERCPEAAAVLEAMVAVYRSGAVIASDLVLGQGRRTLARTTFVW